MCTMCTRPKVDHRSSTLGARLLFGVELHPISDPVFVPQQTFYTFTSYTFTSPINVPILISPINVPILVSRGDATFISDDILYVRITNKKLSAKKKKLCGKKKKKKKKKS